MAWIPYSQRRGFVPAPDISRDELSDRLRLKLWNEFVACRDGAWQHQVGFGGREPLAKHFREGVYLDHLGIPLVVDDRTARETEERIMHLFQSGEFFLVFDLLEAVLRVLGEHHHGEETKFRNALNRHFEYEASAHRVVGTGIVDSLNDAEIESLTSAVQTPHAGAAGHIAMAIRHHYDRNGSPNYQEAVHEAINAVEALVRMERGSPNRFPEALSRLEPKLHPSLETAIDKLYGFATSVGGVRHGNTDPKPVTDPIDEPTSRFVLVACSAIVNYLGGRMR